jgi:hypothetical protein
MSSAVIDAESSAVIISIPSIAMSEDRSSPDATAPRADTYVSPSYTISTSWLVKNISTPSARTSFTQVAIVVAP